MTDLTQSLARYFGASLQHAEALSEMFQEEVVPKNEFHTRMGQYHTRLSFVREGYVRIWRETPDKDITQWISSPGEFTTELGTLLFHQPARLHLQALTDCTFLSLSQDAYRNLPKQVEGWDQVERLFMAKCFMTIEDRVFGFLSMTAEERFEAMQALKPDLFQSVPQQHLASMLGMTPETFSRIRRKRVS